MARAALQTETTKAAAAYATYASLGVERSLTKLAEHLWRQRGSPGDHERSVKVIRNQLGIWSSQHHWQERVQSYDVAQIERKRKDREKELEKLNEEQATYGRAMTALAMKQIQRLIEAKAMNAQAAVQLFKFATDLERLARGAATELTRMEVTADPEGGPIMQQSITIYLPRKDDLPAIVEGQLTSPMDGE